MWILPSQLLNSAPGMAALDLDSKTSLANECEPSHIVSLRGMLKPISSVKWKKDSWMSRLYGTILKPSHTNRFTDWWTSSLRDTLANRSAQQENEQEKKTLATSGLGSQTEFDFFNQECVFSRTSKDISPLDSEKSLESWNKLVTRRRLEYSLRVKSAHLTNASECSSWPTANTRDWKDSVNSVPPSVGQTRGHSLGMAVAEKNWPTAATRDYKGESGSGRQERKGHPTDTLPNAVAQWPTPQTGEAKVCMTGTQNQKMLSHAVHGLPAPANHNTHGNRQESWATPNAFDWNQPETMEQWKKRAAVQAEKGVNLHMPLKSQVTPVSLSAKLNQRWVETLMGIPMGWTSPSCPASVIRNWPKFMSGWLKATTEQTSCDPVATESFQQQQNEHSELF